MNSGSNKMTHGSSGVPDMFSRGTGASRRPLAVAFAFALYATLRGSSLGSLGLLDVIVIVIVIDELNSAWPSDSPIARRKRQPIISATWRGATARGRAKTKTKTACHSGRIGAGFAAAPREGAGHSGRSKASRRGCRHGHQQDSTAPLSDAEEQAGGNALSVVLGASLTLLAAFAGCGRQGA